MRDTGWMFRASWPILRPDFPESMLRVEACEQLDEMARAERCRLVGEVTWSVEDGRLYARCAAMPLDRRARTAEETAAWAPKGFLERQHQRIAELAGERLTDGQIAAVLGGTASGVAYVRRRHGIPPGVGNPTMSGEQQKRRGRAA